MGNFEDELTALLNKYNQEGRSGTPDFLLVQYLLRCLEAFEETTRRRDEWYSQNQPRREEGERT